MVGLLSYINKYYIFWYEFSSHLPQFLEKISLIEDRTWIPQYLDKSAQNEFHDVKLCQIMNLMKTLGMKTQAHYALLKAIVNINKGQLISFEESVLNESQSHHEH